MSGRQDSVGDEELMNSRSYLSRSGMNEESVSALKAVAEIASKAGEKPIKGSRTSEDEAAAPWRPAYELGALAGWCLSAAATSSLVFWDVMPFSWGILPGAASVVGAAHAFRGSWARLAERTALSGAAPLFMTLEDVAAVMTVMAEKSGCAGRTVRPRQGCRMSLQRAASFFGEALRLSDPLRPKQAKAADNAQKSGQKSSGRQADAAARQAARRTFSAMLRRGDARVIRDAGSSPEVSSVWFGVGYAWKPRHAQRLHALTKIDWQSLVLPPGVRRLFTGDPGLPDDAAGLPILHGVGLAEGEAPIMRPLSALGGGTLIVGTTQCGKGVMLTNLIAQAIMRGDVVVIIDPKSSARLRDAVFAATRAAGRGEPLEFHPAFPDRGIRLDPLGSFSRPTELASRVAAVMPADTSGAFASFAWSAVNVAVMGMLFVDERPTLMKLAMVIESGVDELLRRALVKHLDRAADDWRSRLPPWDPTIRGPAPDTDPELLRLVRFWEREVGPTHPEAVIRELLQVFKHNREHYGKITASLQPILTMLTAGALGKTLSPDRDDPDDDRPIMTLERVVRDGGVLYLGLDALPDATVASALGSILLADLTALAGKRYNTGESGVGVEPISLFVDETANVINGPMIELLNKGLEAGVHVTAAMQTVADLAARLGDRDRAMMALGNLNNLIVLRTKDQATQRFVSEVIGKTVVASSEASISTSSGGIVPDFRTSVTRRLKHESCDLVPTDLLGKLPNLEFFASLSGGRLWKGRVPILKLGQAAPEGILWKTLGERRRRSSHPLTALLDDAVCTLFTRWGRRTAKTGEGGR